MKITSLGYRTDVMVRVLEGAEVTAHDEYLVVASPAQPSFWWGNFILAAAPPRAGEEQLWQARHAEAFPACVHVAIGIDVTSADGVDLSGFQAAGFTVLDNIVLTAGAVHEPPRPNRDATIRPLVGDDDWRQSEQLRTACDDQEITTGRALFIAERITQARAITEAGAGVWLGAFQGDRLVAQLGLVSDGGPLARFQDVETHPAARRQGLAGTLVCHAGRYGLDRMGASTLVMVADAPDAMRIYRSAGFTPEEAQFGLQRPTRAP